MASNNGNSLKVELAHGLQLEERRGPRQCDVAFIRSVLTTMAEVMRCHFAELERRYPDGPPAELSVTLACRIQFFEGALMGIDHLTGLSTRLVREIRELLRPVDSDDLADDEHVFPK